MTRKLLTRESPCEEQRKDPRTGIQIWATEKTEEYTCFHLVSNLSLSGLHIEKKLPLPIGSEINLEMTLSELDETIPLKCVVINTYKDPDSNVTGTGVEFVGINEDVKKKLETYIEKIKKQR